MAWQPQGEEKIKLIFNFFLLLFSNVLDNENRLWPLCENKVNLKRHQSQAVTRRVVSVPGSPVFCSMVPSPPLGAFLCLLVESFLWRSLLLSYTCNARFEPVFWNSHTPSANTESELEFVLSILLSISIGSKGDSSGTQLKFFQMVSLLPDGVFNRRERERRGGESCCYQPRAKQGPVTLFLPSLFRMQNDLRCIRISWKFFSRVCYEIRRLWLVCVLFRAKYWFSLIICLPVVAWFFLILTLKWIKSPSQAPINIQELSRNHLPNVQVWQTLKCRWISENLSSSSSVLELKSNHSHPWHKWTWQTSHGCGGREGI